MAMEKTIKIAMPCVILWCLFAAGAGVSASTTVSAGVDYEKIGEEDQLALTVTIEGEGGHGVDFINLPDLEGFDVVSSSQRSSIHIINGVTTSSKTFVFTLLPRKQGNFEIPPVSVEIGGKTFQTEPVEVTVVAGSIVSASPRSRSDQLLDPFSRRRSPQRSKKEPIDDNVFIVAEVSKQDIFYGEQLTLTYKLYTRYNIRGIDMSQPSLTGFWVEPVELPSRLKPTVASIKGKQYSVFIVKQSALFPSTTGELVIDPLTCTIDVQAPSSDPFFDSFFFSNDERIYRKTREKTVTVKPLPELDKPEDFNGIVGDFTMTAGMDKHETKVNDAINLKITIAGKGNLKAINKPELPEHPDFKVFDSKESSDIGFKNGFFQGRKSWEYVLVPTSAGELAMEPVQFSYFLPETGEYRTERSEPFRIQVVPGDAQEEVMISLLPDGREVKRRKMDIHYIKPAPARLKNEGKYFYQIGYFALVMIFPLLANMGALVYRRKRESRWRDTAGFRFRQAPRVAARHLRETRKFLKAGEREKFFEALTKSLHTYLADKLNLSAGGLTVRVIEEALSEKKISTVTMEGVKSCLDHIDLARFGRHELTTEEMERLNSECRQMITMLEKEYPAK